ncbi:MAG: hypothetical protein J3Q66DRAFT_340268, partial [Benniella sp.]
LFTRRQTRRTHCWTCGFVYCDKRNMHKKLLLNPAWEGYNIAMESANSHRRSYGLDANHFTLTQSSFSVPSSSSTTTTMTQLSTGSIGASSGTSPLSFHSSQPSGRQTTTFAKQQPLKKSPSELVAAAHAHASAIAIKKETEFLSSERKKINKNTEGLRQLA